MLQDKSKVDVKGTKTLIVVDSVDAADFLNILGERDVGSIRMSNYIWDTSTLANVRMVQPLTAAGIVDIDSATKGVFWAETRIEYLGSDPVYIGYNETLGAATSSVDWYVKKLTYTSGNATRIQVQLTSWDLSAAGWS